MKDRGRQLFFRDLDARWRPKRRIPDEPFLLGRNPAMCRLAFRTADIPDRSLRIFHDRGKIVFSCFPAVKKCTLNGRSVRHGPLGYGDEIEINDLRLRVEHRRPAGLIAGLAALGLILISIYFIDLFRLDQRWDFMTRRKAVALARANRVEELVLLLDQRPQMAEEIQGDKEIEEALNRAEESLKPVQADQNDLATHLKIVLKRMGVADTEVPESGLRAVESYVRNKHFRGRVERCMERSVKYADYVLSVLQEHQLPRELFYVAFNESSLIPTAQAATSTASGMWQFIRGTRRAVGITDPFDYQDSTRGAAKYFSWQVAVFGPDNVLLSIAAYHCGEGEMRKRLREEVGNSKERTYWHLRDLKIFTHDETNHYVPKILAMAVLGTFPESYGLTRPPGYQLGRLDEGESSVEKDAAPPSETAENKPSIQM